VAAIAPAAQRGGGVVRLVRIDGELAEIVPTAPGRAKLVYLACEPKGRLPTGVEYGEMKLLDRLGCERLTLKDDGRVLFVERVEPDVRDSPKAHTKAVGEVRPLVT
jgi:hypothetical protein